MSNSIDEIWRPDLNDDEFFELAYHRLSDPTKYSLDKELITALAAQEVRHRKEYYNREAKLQQLRQLPTWEDDNVPHDSWSNHCMECGRWLIATDINGQYGPTWECPACNDLDRDLE
ncbi:MAG TPA: hypothetical protein VII94_06200 [Candidatus Saccharimonadales bacterium]